MANEVKIAYDKSDLRGIARSFKGMDEAAIDAAKRESNALAQYMRGKIVQAANITSNVGDDRVAQGSRVSKSSRIGEISFGYASQKFSGGGSTLSLWKGLEFGSNKFKQFPRFSGKLGRGSRGWFIFPTLRENQKEVVRQWEEAFSRILKEWG
jgi:hypothetical protein